MANLGIEIKRKCHICGKVFIIKTLDSINSIIVNWTRVGELLSIYSKGKPIPFKAISAKLLEDIKLFMLSAP